jgi:hypothetical protein
MTPQQVAHRWLVTAVSATIGGSCVALFFDAEILHWWYWAVVTAVIVGVSATWVVYNRADRKAQRGGE